jgi:acetoin utilization deacetylase AcuC-like enzyme
VIRVFHSRRYFADLGEHIMPIGKFGLVREAIEASGVPVDLREPARATDEQLERVHTKDYIHAVDTGEPRALAQSQKFPWSKDLAEAVRWTNGGCVAGIDAALDDGVAANLASGFHHAHADHGEGFCTYNGLVVALEDARARGRLARGLVLDMDLHYGNGTASLLATRPWAFQLSIYGNWYKANLATKDVDSERAADTANAWSLPVPNGADGEQYVDFVRRSLGGAIERAKPDVLLYQAGADPYQEDPYSPLMVDHEALRARDTFVFETARAKGLPVLWVLAGGYTPDVTKVVRVHVNTFLAANEVFGA